MGEPGFSGFSKAPVGAIRDFIVFGTVTVPNFRNFARNMRDPQREWETNFVKNLFNNVFTGLSTEETAPRAFWVGPGTRFSKKLPEGW